MSLSSTASYSASAMQSLSRSRMATRTTTPSMTPPMCRAPISRVISLVGASGFRSAPVAASTAGNAGMYTAGSCSAGFKTFLPGSRIVFYLYLGLDVPLGGTLTISTCGLTSNNTLLYIGTGCPTWAVPFACIKGNDDAGQDGSTACTSNALASYLSISSVSTRDYFIQVGGRGTGDIVSGLRWQYDAPSKSAAATPSKSGTRSITGTHSRMSSVSRTRKPK